MSIRCPPKPLYIVAALGRAFVTLWPPNAGEYVASVRILVDEVQFVNFDGTVDALFVATAGETKRFNTGRLATMKMRSLQLYGLALAVVAGMNSAVQAA